jgi:hypothetical protein
MVDSVSSVDGKQSHQMKNNGPIQGASNHMNERPLISAFNISPGVKSVIDGIPSMLSEKKLSRK